MVPPIGYRMFSEITKYGLKNKPIALDSDLTSLAWILHGLKTRDYGTTEYKICCSALKCMTDVTNSWPFATLCLFVLLSINWFHLWIALITAHYLFRLILWTRGLNLWRTIISSSIKTCSRYQVGTGNHHFLQNEDIFLYALDIASQC